MPANSRANRGKTLEDLVEKAFRDAFLKGLPVWVQRQNNKWVPVRNGSRAVPVRGRGSPVDFIGSVLGVPVALECKEYRAGRRLILNESRFPEREIVALRDFESVGGRGFVVAVFRESDTLAVYPFPVVYEAWKAYKAGKGEASVPFSRRGVLIGNAKSISSLPAACVALIDAEKEGGRVVAPDGFVYVAENSGLFG